MSKSRLTGRLRRLDAARLRLENPFALPITLLATEDVPVEEDGLAQLFAVLEQLVASPDLGLRQVVLTPDFHRGASIPVGTVLDAVGAVVPAAIGNDIGCGMRLLVLDLRAEELRPHLDPLERRLRAIFFEGARDLPLSPRQRAAMLREGLSGLLSTCADNAGTGAWRGYDLREQERDLARVHRCGSLPATGEALAPFADYVQGSGRQDGRDAHLGTVGGGNHFVELQEITPLEATAHGWGLERGKVAVQVHTGSLGFGHRVAARFAPRGRSERFHALALDGADGEGARYLSAQHAAANFAFANRLFLGLMARRAVEEVLGRELGARLVYDAPHNLAFAGSDGQVLHRKGACPAPGPEPEQEESPFRFVGHPVLVPGSMGASSYVLAGLGNEELLASAAHGAGRALSRGDAQHVDEERFRRALEPLRVVTPVDLRSPQVRGRPELLARLEAGLKEEAPFAYKAIEPVVRTLELAGVARPVARLWPLLTVKGA